MMLNSLMNDGQVQAYFSDAAQAEMSFQTSAVGADVSGGGVRINMIPKDGGNTFSGSAFVGGTNGSWQADNVTDELRAAGLQSGDAVAHIKDYNFSFGGPIMRDKLWFFASWRWISTNEIAANSFKPDGSPAIEDQWIQNQMVRMTWQVSPREQVQRSTRIATRNSRATRWARSPRTTPPAARSRTMRCTTRRRPSGPRR